MIRDEKLSLPDNWEAILEQFMLKPLDGTRLGRVYICSPCRAETQDGVIRNMKAARVYMFYTYQYFPRIPKAPHAYLPILLNDIYDADRALALQFGLQYLKNSDIMFVCGGILSEGMYGEIEEALREGISIHVFNEAVYDELCKRFDRDGIDPDYLQYEEDHLHYALAWGADELAPYWEAARA